MARLGAPDIEGEIIDDPDRSDVEKGMTVASVAGGVAKGLIALVMLPLQPLIVLSALIFRGRSPKERVPHYVVRLNSPDGTVHVARFERELRKATIAAGDYVSIWGTERSGVCIVRRAYNHSVSAEVL